MRRRRPLPLWLRILLLGVGWFIILIGVAGLALPGIQGVLTIAVGAAVLSAASEMFYRWLKRLLHRWPRVWHPIESLREKMHDRFARHHDEDDEEPESDSPAEADERDSSG